jgi:hypothetical protein
VGRPQPHNTATGYPPAFHKKAALSRIHISFVLERRRCGEIGPAEQKLKDLKTYFEKGRISEENRLSTQKEILRGMLER